MEIFQKSPKRQPSLKKPISSLAQVALSSNQYTLNVQRMEMILAQTTAPKVPEWPSYANFRKLTQKPHFLKKCKRGTKGNFSKIAQKKPSFERAKSTLAEMVLSSTQYTLKVQRLGKTLAHKAAQRVPELPSYGNFRMVTKNPHFLKTFKGGTKEKDQGKIAQKVALI